MAGPLTLVLARHALVEVEGGRRGRQRGDRANFVVEGVKGRRRLRLARERRVGD